MERINSELIVGRPDALHTREMCRPGLSCFICIVWSSADEFNLLFLDVPINKANALTNLTYLRDWFSKVENEWMDGEVHRIECVGGVTNLEARDWASQHIVTPWCTAALADG